MAPGRTVAVVNTPRRAHRRLRQPPGPGPLVARHGGGDRAGPCGDGGCTSSPRRSSRRRCSATRSPPTSSWSATRTSSGRLPVGLAGAGARHRAERPRRRDEPARLRLGPARRPRPRPRCEKAARPGLRDSRPRTRGPDAATSWSSAARRFLTAYQNARLRGALPRARGARGRAPSRRCAPGSDASRRGGGPLLLQAAGLQGRVRGGAAVQRRRASAPSSRREFEGDYR